MDSNTWNYPNIPRPLWHSGSQAESAQQINPRQSGAAQSAANGSQTAGTQQKNPTQFTPQMNSTFPAYQQGNPTMVSPAQSNPQMNSTLPAYQQGNPTMVSPAQSNPQMNSTLPAYQQGNPTMVSLAQSNPQMNSTLPAYQQGNPTMVSPAQSNAQPPRAVSAFPAETPIGMAYVPFQKFGMLYDSDTALQNGTIFAELFKPWLGGRAFLPNGSNTPVTAELNDLYSNYFRMSGEGSVRK